MPEGPFCQIGAHYYLTQGQGHRKHITQYPVHHVAYSPERFEAATSNHYERDAFTRKYIIRPLH